MKYEGRVPRDDVNVTSRHPLKEGVTLLAGILATVALVLALTTLLIDRLVPFVPYSWEGRLFPDFSSLRKDPADAADSERQRALESLLARLVRHWPDAPDGLRIGLMEAEQPNALAFPGGLILVTTALADAVESENELAFIIGHELGHYRGRDHLESLGRGLALGLVLAAIGRSGTAGDLVGYSAELTSRSFSRDQESAADAFGLELVAAEFSHVNGATDFFARLPGPETALERSLATYLATHPLNEDRIESMKRLAREKGWASEGFVVPLALGASP